MRRLFVSEEACDTCNSYTRILDTNECSVCRDYKDYHRLKRLHYGITRVSEKICPECGGNERYVLQDRCAPCFSARLNQYAKARPSETKSRRKDWEGRSSSYRQYVKFAGMAITEAQRREFSGKEEQRPEAIPNPW